MAQSGDKLTKFESGTTIVTADVANSLYGGLYGTAEGAALSTTDPKNVGHVHDGQHLDGHSQKIDLVSHVTGQLRNANLGTRAVTPRNIQRFLNQADAIAESEVISGDTYYYLDLSDIRAEMAIENEPYYFVYKPSGTAEGNVYDDFSELYTDLTAVNDGTRAIILIIDDSAIASETAVTLPAGTFNLQNVIIVSVSPSNASYAVNERAYSSYTALAFNATTIFSNPGGFIGRFLIRSTSSSATPIIFDSGAAGDAQRKTFYLKDCIVSNFDYLTGSLPLSDNRPIIIVENATDMEIICDSSQIGGSNRHVIDIDTTSSLKLVLRNQSNLETGALKGTGGATLEVVSGADCIFSTTQNDWVVNPIPLTDITIYGQQFTGATASDDGLKGLVPQPVAGEENYFLQGDGTWAAPTNAGAFTLDTGVVREDVSGSGVYATDDFVFGSPQLDDSGTANEDSRFLFDKSKAAFRAGSVTSTEWNDANRGSYSFAVGLNNEASGDYSSVVAGEQNVSDEDYGMSHGAFASANSLMQHSHGGGEFDTGRGVGSSQGSNYVFKYKNLAAVGNPWEVTLLLDGSPAVISSNELMFVEIQLILYLQAGITYKYAGARAYSTLRSDATGTVTITNHNIAFGDLSSPTYSVGVVSTAANTWGVEVTLSDPSGYPGAPTQYQTVECVAYVRASHLKVTASPNFDSATVIT